MRSDIHVMGSVFPCLPVLMDWRIGRFLVGDDRCWIFNGRWVFDGRWSSVGYVVATEGSTIARCPKPVNGIILHQVDSEQVFWLC